MCRAQLMHRPHKHLGAMRVVAEHVEAGAAGRQQHNLSRCRSLRRSIDRIAQGGSVHHRSDAFDHRGIAADRNLAFPLDRLRELGDVKYRPCPLLRKMVRAGHLGEGDRLRGRPGERVGELRAHQLQTFRLVRRVAHSVADDLVKHYTGRPGVAMSRIAFVSQHGDGKEIYVMDYDGQRIRRLVEGPHGIGEFTIGWDGRDDGGRPPGWL